jgi:hypothetical protein
MHKRMRKAWITARDCASMDSQTGVDMKNCRCLTLGTMLLIAVSASVIQVAAQVVAEYVWDSYSRRKLHHERGTLKLCRHFTRYSKGCMCSNARRLILSNRVKVRRLQNVTECLPLYTFSNKAGDSPRVSSKARSPGRTSRLASRVPVRS